MAYSQQDYELAGQWIAANLNDPQAIANQIKSMGLSQEDILKAVQTQNAGFTMQNVNDWFSTYGLNPWAQAAAPATSPTVVDTQPAYDPYSIYGSDQVRAFEEQGIDPYDQTTVEQYLTGYAPTVTATEQQIRDLYQQYFNRAPDPAGLSFWVTAGQQGYTPEMIAAEFAKSPEYAALQSAKAIGTSSGADIIPAAEDLLGPGWQDTGTGYAKDDTVTAGMPLDNLEDILHPLVITGGGSGEDPSQTYRVTNDTPVYSGYYDAGESGMLPLDFYQNLPEGAVTAAKIASVLGFNAPPTVRVGQGEDERDTANYDIARWLQSYGYSLETTPVVPTNDGRVGWYTYALDKDGNPVKGTAQFTEYRPDIGANLLTTAASFGLDVIAPGTGQLVRGLQALSNENYLGALISAIGAGADIAQGIAATDAGVAALADLGSTSSSMTAAGQTAADIASGLRTTGTAINTALAIKNGDWASAIAGGMNLTGAQNIGGFSQKDFAAIGNIVRGVENNDLASLLYGANNFINNPNVAVAADAASVANAIKTGNISSAIGAAKRLNTALQSYLRTSANETLAAAYADPSRALDVLGNQGAYDYTPPEAKAVEEAIQQDVADQLVYDGSDYQDFNDAIANAREFGYTQVRDANGTVYNLSSAAPTDVDIQNYVDRQAVDALEAALTFDATGYSDKNAAAKAAAANGQDRFTFSDGQTYVIQQPEATSADVVAATKDFSGYGSREAAFAAARKLFGPNDTFTYNGKEYSTATAEERPDLAGVARTTQQTATTYSPDVIGQVKSYLGGLVNNPDFNPADLSAADMSKFIDTYANATDAQRQQLLSGTYRDSFQVIDMMLGKPSGALASQPAPAGTQELKAYEPSLLDTAAQIGKAGVISGGASLVSTAVQGMELVNRALGGDTEAFQTLQNDLKAYGDQELSKLKGNEQAVANGVASMTISLPFALIGGAAAAVPAVVATVANGTWMESKEAGLTDAQAAARTIAMSGIEAAGELIGVKNMNAILKGVPVTAGVEGLFNAAKEYAKMLGKENFTELLTTVGQFTADKIPEFGLGQKATVEDLGEALKDTVIATTTAVLGSSAVSAALRSGNAALDSAAQVSDVEFDPLGRQNPDMTRGTRYEDVDAGEGLEKQGMLSRPDITEVALELGGLNYGPAINDPYLNYINELASGAIGQETQQALEGGQTAQLEAANDAARLLGYEAANEVEAANEAAQEAPDIIQALKDAGLYAEETGAEMTEEDVKNLFRDVGSRSDTSAQPATQAAEQRATQQTTYAEQPNIDLSGIDLSGIETANLPATVTTQTQPAAQTEAQTGTQTATQAQIGTQTATQAQTALQTAVQTLPTTVTKTQVETLLDTIPDSAVKTAVQTALQTQQDTLTRTQVQQLVDTATQTQTQTQTETAVQTALQTAVQTLPDTVTKTQVQTLVDALPQTQTETELQTLLQTATEVLTKTQVETLLQTATDVVTQTQTPGTTTTVTTGTTPPGTEPPGTEPPGTEPPGTEPPGTEPPGTEPPGTKPPGTEQLGTEPPGTEQPLTVTPTTTTETTVPGITTKETSQAKKKTTFPAALLPLLAQPQQPMLMDSKLANVFYFGTLNPGEQQASASVTDFQAQQAKLRRAMEEAYIAQEEESEENQEQASQKQLLETLMAAVEGDQQFANIDELMEYVLRG